MLVDKLAGSKFSLSLIDECQILYRITPIIYLSDGQTLKNLTISGVIEAVGKLELLCSDGGNVKWPNLLESTLAIFNKIEKVYALQPSNSISEHIL